jgi:hypothetical protein
MPIPLPQRRMTNRSDGTALKRTGPARGDILKLILERGASLPS